MGTDFWPPLYILRSVVTTESNVFDYTKAFLPGKTHYKGSPFHIRPCYPGSRHLLVDESSTTTIIT